MRRVLYCTGSRAYYGPARSTLKAIQACADLQLEIAATGMHLCAEHGETVDEIVADGFTVIDRVPGRELGDGLAAMSASVGNYIRGFSYLFEKSRPDIVLVLGDRGEALAAALAASYANILVAHLVGGSQSGSIDDSVRHSITKFAHLHLVAEPTHRLRVLQMGESDENIVLVGLPGADLTKDMTFSRAEICAHFALDPKTPYVLTVQHAVSHESEQADGQIVETLEALVRMGLPTLLANPNDDAGGRAILKRYQEYASRHSTLRILEPPRSRELFASLTGYAGVLLGNSSSGTCEAMSVPVPVVNIGQRQRGREQNSCMINVGHHRDEIEVGLNIALRDAKYRERLQAFHAKFPHKDTEQRVIEALRRVDLEKANQPKDFVLRLTQS